MSGPGPAQEHAQTPDFNLHLQFTHFKSDNSNNLRIINVSCNVLLMRNNMNTNVISN